MGRAGGRGGLSGNIMSIMLVLFAVIGFVMFMGGAALLATALYHMRKEALELQRQEAALVQDDRMAA